MEAKDTVIEISNIQNLDIPCETCHTKPFWETGNDNGVIECMECLALKHREFQAEISFKAGRQDEQRKIYSGLAGIMKEAPDLKSLETALSYSLAELKGEIDGTDRR